MLTNDLILVFGIGACLALLAMLQTFLAARHDHVVSAAGPVESLRALEEQIEQKRLTITDLEEDLRKRREALANIADIQAEVDALVRQRDDLVSEWNQLEERRNEVRDLRNLLETTLAEKQGVDSELATARAELEAVQDRLTQAERLFDNVETMKKEKEELESEIAELGEQEKELSEARERVEQLEKRSHELGSLVAKLEGQAAAEAEQAEELHERTKSEREGLAKAQSEHTEIAAQIAAARESVHELENKRAALQAHVARLDDEIGEASGVGAPSGEEARDERMKELKVLPPVLENLKSWPEFKPKTETEALERVFRHLHRNGLEFHRRVIYAFHTAMKVNETTQMAVLAGISGTGKSQLPRQYSAGMGIGFLQVPVQPRWDSPQDLMGFYNYIEKRFRPTDMARALYQLDLLNNPDSEFNDRMLMILLDEMNLARVEYYFSDFLSRLESRPPSDQVGDSNLRKDAEIEMEIPMPKGMDAPRIFPGYNLLFAGTMNEDESTQSLSDKVVDRANVLRFAAPEKIHTGVNVSDMPKPEALRRSQWKSWVRPVSDVEDHDVVRNSVEKMVRIMKEFKHPFGHRLGRAIMAYVANYPDAQGVNRFLDPLADQVEMRLLPKLRGVEIDNAEGAFDGLQEFVAGDLNDNVLAQAIEESVAIAREGTGQFVWTGATR